MKERNVVFYLPKVDLAILKTMAKKEKIPYQALIASVLHKFVKGRLTPSHLSHKA